MEEEVGIKVTRLRRRLSVESEDVKSPSTPTKKRGGRLAAKPQLELIDENAPPAVPKRIRKSTSRDVAEPVEEKPVTPARRSIRIRSNTSIVSETPDVAEDMGTPSRRSTRIKSNTSIIVETVQNVNSPRAKRAARRSSLLGSDNEAPVTPARLTRRTRKDSTSSIDKPVEPNAGKIGGQIKEVIVEESENNVKETKSTESPKSDSSSHRKSPRLVGKTGRESSSLDNDNKENEPRIYKGTSKTTTETDRSVSETKAEPTKEINQKASEQNNLSVTSSNLIKALEEAPKKDRSIMNKSTTAVDVPQIKSKRNRTKSWTTISVEPTNDNSFCSDSEASKKKHKKKNNSLNLSNLSGSGDGLIRKINKNEQENVNVSLNLSTISDKKKKKRSERSMVEDTETSVHEVSVTSVHEVSVTSVNLNKSTEKISKAKDVSVNAIEEVDNLKSAKKYDSSDTDKLFEQAPIGLIQSLVFIEDSDSNQGSIGKGNTDKVFDNGDQCVPVVVHNLGQDKTSKETKTDMSYEPMDIDETMPENVSLTTFEDQEPELEKKESIFNTSQVKNDSINNSKKKSAISNIVPDNSINDGSNKSQRKSSIAESMDNDVKKDSNKSKRKSSISNVVSEDMTDGMFNMSNRKSLVIDNHDEKSNKTKRKSSITNTTTENNIDEDSYNSMVNDERMNKGSNKSKRKSSISNINNNTNENSNEFSISDIANEEVIDKSLNISKRKSLVSTMVAEVNVEKRKISISDPCNDSYDIMNKSSNKSKRKSSISNKANDDSMDKSSNKSKNKSLILPAESQTLNKTENENKSTLVLSQIKDISESEINIESNVPKDSDESNEQLSKSVNVPNVNTEKESDKKNLSLTYSTSTPLQQKSIKKLGMQINSSIITPNNVSKMEKKTRTMSKKEASILSQENDSDSSEDEDSEEESSLEMSKMINDEAEEASDDYESGDSRDEEEKEYEEQHAIVDNGETLDTEEDEYSDSSDYDKDSFIVSSDAEDNDLLSGSGDDLSMSADELSMSVKSKQKYNERKIKEQKQASRDMFEARHKLNESDKSTKSNKSKSKKNNRQRFESSSSESDNEIKAQSKKNNRQRIDSSQDITMAQLDADKSLSKKNKAKRLSESVCDDNATDEKEITIREENQTEKNDPLSLQYVIKQEPKTPQKDLNISTVAVINMDEIEEVDVDENVSIMKSNQTSDPLHATIAQNDTESDDDEDSISENEEITQNYESVLNNLNKSNSKIKSLDISLNLNKKVKQTAKEPVVDQLNLTQVKKTKKKKADASENATETKNLDMSLNNKIANKVDKQLNEEELSEGSSDSIDMKLLFPEDSNDSEVVEVKTSASVKKQKTIIETTEKEDVQDVPEDFIPLKRTQGKTNILENIDVANKSKDESILNVSGKKKNKRKSSHTEEALIMSTQPADNLGFFIDTTGTLTNVKKTYANTSIKNSAKKNKEMNNVSFIVDDDSNDAPLEISYRSEKNKSKQDLNTTQSKVETVADSAAIETPSQSGKKKKKNKKGLNSSQNLTEISIIEHTDGKDVIHEEEISKKRKRRSSANQTIEEILDKDDAKVTKALEESLSKKKQKKKRKISNNDEDVETQVQDSVTQTQEQEKAPIEYSKKKNKVPTHQKVDEIDDESTKKIKKRKERDDDDAHKISKVLKQNSFDKVHVTRLPANVLKQLDDKPKKDIVETRKSKIISTSSFVVEETKKRRNKPSNYLEESVYLNHDFETKKPKLSIKNPKVLPFIPTASTSDKGFTTNFRVNIISQTTQFVAQSSDVSNFKNDYLQKKRIKKLGTFEMYKRQRNIKISKF